MRPSIRSFVLFAVLAVPAVAQSNQGSFRGRIVDADTGQTVTEEGVTIVVTKTDESSASRRVIDVKGEFVVPDLPLGRYQMQFRYKGISTGTMDHFQVTGTASATPANIYLRLPGEMTGVILDKDGEPVQGAEVLVVGRTYLAGQAMYSVATRARPTDDRGRYNLSARLESGLPYFLLVLPPSTTRPTLSGTPALEGFWYPGRPGLAQPFVVRSGEKKNLDFVMEKKKTYCVDGTLTANGQPAERGFEIAIPEVAGHRGTTGGTQGVIASGQSDASGHFQACGLWQGAFLLAAGMNNPGPGPQTTQFLYTADSYGRTNLSIVDRDVHDVKLNAQSAVSLAAEIRWDNPETPQNNYRLYFTPLNRVTFESQPFMINAKDVVVPSRFSVSLLPSSDYWIGLARFDGSSGWYLKDVTCDGTTLRERIKVGESDCGLRIVVGTDMGNLSATVLDKDNKPDPDSSVCVAASSAVTGEEISSTGTCSPIEAGTTAASIPLRPDRYLAVAMPTPTANWVEYFLANRGQGTPIEIKPRATAQVTLKSSNRR